MVMNKKGFLKFLEAIVAVLIVLGFVIAILPTKENIPSRLPPDLEQTTNSILKEIQETPEFRKCVFGSESGFSDINGTGSQCIFEYIEYITRPKQLHQWNYGVRICTFNDPINPECNYYGQKVGESNDFEDVQDVNNEVLRDVLPGDKNVYIRTLSISVEDILGEGEAGSVANPTEGQAGVPHLVTIFAWSKS